MKKFITLIASTLLPVATLWATTAQDTVRIIDNPEKVVITEDSLGTHVQVLSIDGNRHSNYDYSISHASNDVVKTKQSTDWNLKLPFSSDKTGVGDTTKVSHWSVVFNGLYGGAGWLNGKESGSQFDRCAHATGEIGMLSVLGVEYNTHHGQWFNLALGVDYSVVNLHDKHGMRYYKDDAGVVGLMPVSADVENFSTSLNMFALQLSLTCNQRIYRHIKVFAAPILRYNVGASLNSSWKLGDEHTSIDTYHLGINRWSFDVMGGITWKSIGVYARWRPGQVFKENYGPKFSRFTLGLAVGF